MQDAVREIEPELALRQRGDDPFPDAGTWFGRPVDRPDQRPAQHDGNAQPLDIGEEAGDNQRAGKDRQADDDDQGAEPRREPGHGDAETRDGEWQSEQDIAGVDAELTEEAESLRLSPCRPM